MAPSACPTSVEQVGYETNLLGYLGMVRELDIWGWLRGFSSNGERRRQPPRVALASA